MPSLPPILRVAVPVSVVLLLAGLVCTFLRLVYGPSIADRVMAIDLFAACVMGIIILFSFFTGASVYLNAVLVMALISFIGTVAFARYLERSALE